MPADWGAAAASIAAAFRDPEPITYRTKAGDTFTGLPVIRAVGTAPKFGEQVKAPRKITYELARHLLLARPKNEDSFMHRGRRWSVVNVADLDDVDAWELTVADIGAA